jgi:hypothetical protein
MSSESLVADILNIEDILAFRNTVQNAKIPAQILKSIQTIHKSIVKENERQQQVKLHPPHPSQGSRPPSHRNNGYKNDRNDRNDRNHSNGNHIKFQSNWRNMNQSQENPVTDTSRSDASFQKQYKPDQNDRTRRVPYGKESTDSTPYMSQNKPSGFKNKQPHQRYVSKFNKKENTVDDKIINTILLGKLNKFSASNYNEIKEFIVHIISDENNEMVKCFMKIVFEKAVSEEVFCPLYAQLLSELTVSYPVLLTEMNMLYEQYMEIFEEVVDGTNENYDELCARNIQKKYRRGYSQFLAELIKYNIIDTSMFMKIITKIMRQIELNSVKMESIKLNEEFADCLMKIMKGIKSAKQSDDEKTEDMLQLICDVLKTDVSQQIKPYSVRNELNAGISNKARFTFLDMYEMIQKF